MNSGWKSWWDNHDPALWRKDFRDSLHSQSWLSWVTKFLPHRENTPSSILMSSKIELIFSGFPCTRGDKNGMIMTPKTTGSSNGSRFQVNSILFGIKVLLRVEMPTSVLKMGDSVKKQVVTRSLMKDVIQNQKMWPCLLEAGFWNFRRANVQV